MERRSFLKILSLLPAAAIPPRLQRAAEAVTVLERTETPSSEALREADARLASEFEKATPEWEEQGYVVTDRAKIAREYGFDCLKPNEIVVRGNRVRVDGPQYWGNTSYDMAKTDPERVVPDNCVWDEVPCERCDRLVWTDHDYVMCGECQDKLRNGETE